MNGVLFPAELTALQQRIQPLYDRLASHPLYASLETIEDLHSFMESHVFAVWDFMCLLKALQRGLTSVEVPWLPSATPGSRRLVNEIVLGEESDVYEGQPLSHFELYRLAMQQCGADTTPIDTMLDLLRQGRIWRDALLKANAPTAAIRFVETTFDFLEDGRLHIVAAAFTFGREDLIPEMFRGFIHDQDERLGGRLSIFRWYLERHIEVDGDEHGPMALQMVSELCGDHPERWREASDAAVAALEARIALWDDILVTVSGQRSVSVTNSATL